MEEIVLFHTNDLHSHFENWPKIRRLVKSKRSLYQKEGKTVVTIDLGDFSDRCHPLTEATDGRANVAIMNTLAYDHLLLRSKDDTDLKSHLNQWLRLFCPLFGTANVWI